MSGDRTSASAMDRRSLLVGGVLLATAGAAAARMPEVVHKRVNKDVFEKLVPDTIGEWRFLTSSGLVLPPPDSLSERLYDNLLTRAYENPAGDLVMLLMAYNNLQDGVVQIHRPEFCYPAGGYALTPTETIALPPTSAGPSRASFFSANSADRSEQVLYWTRLGDYYPVTWAEQRLSVMRANLNGEIPDGLMVRLSMIGNDREGSLPAILDFVRTLGDAAPSGLRSILTGVGTRAQQRT